MILDLNIPSDDLIDGYIDVTIPPKFPMAQATLGNFTKALFKSSSTVDGLQAISNITDPGAIPFFLLPELSPIMKKYREEKYARFVYYSMIRKDLSLYQAVLAELFGDAATAQSSSLSLRYGFMFLQKPSSYTDAGLYTDPFPDGSTMATDESFNATPVIVFEFRYKVDPFVLPGLFLLADLRTRLDGFYDFVTVIKPARVFAAMLASPVFYHNYQYADQTDFSDQVEYVMGAVVTYNGKTYRCNVPTTGPGPFVSTAWLYIPGIVTLATAFLDINFCYGLEDMDPVRLDEEYSNVILIGQQTEKAEVTISPVTLVPSAQTPGKMVPGIKVYAFECPVPPEEVFITKGGITYFGIGSVSMRNDHPSQRELDEAAYLLAPGEKAEDGSSAWEWQSGRLINHMPTGRYMFDYTTGLYYVWMNDYHYRPLPTPENPNPQQPAVINPRSWFAELEVAPAFRFKFNWPELFKIQDIDLFRFYLYIDFAGGAQSISTVYWFELDDNGELYFNYPDNWPDQPFHVQYHQWTLPARTQGPSFSSIENPSDFPEWQDFPEFTDQRPMPGWDQTDVPAEHLPRPGDAWITYNGRRLIKMTANGVVYFI